MKLQGRDQVYLMSRFIGEEWEKALREATGGGAPLFLNRTGSIGSSIP